jgi:hypothetical protein
LSSRPTTSLSGGAVACSSVVCVRVMSVVRVRDVRVVRWPQAVRTHLLRTVMVGTELGKSWGRIFHSSLGFTGSAEQK